MGKNKPLLIQSLTGAAIILHGFASFGLLLHNGGLDLSLLKILSFWHWLSIVWFLSGIRAYPQFVFGALSYFCSHAGIGADKF